MNFAKITPTDEKTPSLTIDEDVLQVEDIKKRSMNGAISYVLRSLFLQGIGVLSYFLLSALLSTGDFGIYGIVVSISSFFTIISDIGLAASLIQKKEAPTIRDLRTVFTVQQILAWVVCLLIIATAWSLHLSGRLELPAVFLAGAFALSFPIVSLKTISSILLERQLEFGKLAMPAVVEAIVFNGIVLFFAWRGMGITSYSIAVLARAIVGVIIMLSIKRWPVGFAFSKPAFSDLMKVGIKFQANDVIAKIKDELFTVITVFLLSKSELGYITWANQASRLPYRFGVDSVMAITFPTFARLQHDAHLLKRAIEKTLFFVSLAVFPLLAGFAVMFIPLTSLIPKYAQWQPALLTLGFMCVSIAFSSISTPLINTLNAIGKINTSLRFMLIWTLLQWTLTPLAIWRFGFNGVAIASVIISFTVIFVVRALQREVQFAFVEQIWRQLVASLCMAVFLFQFIPLWSQSFLLFCAGVLSGGLLFIGLLALLGFEKIRGELLSLVRR
ncbi:oligosaccharide flippase family protein [Candidatus Woesebacteria bacterium]|nr:oligosaccharide flippase family protein [Candidatus Woesebacteria bacterium]